MSRNYPVGGYKRKARRLKKKYHKRLDYIFSIIGKMIQEELPPLIRQQAIRQEGFFTPPIYESIIAKEGK